MTLFRALILAASALTVAVLAPGTAQAVETCVELEFSTSPVQAASGEKLVCVVVNDTESNLDVEIVHKGMNGADVKVANRTIPEGGFRSSTLMAPFGGTEVFCEVEVVVCFPTPPGGGTGVDSIGLFVNSFSDPLHGSLKRQDAANRDISESELALRDVDEPD